MSKGSPVSACCVSLAGRCFAVPVFFLLGLVDEGFVVPEADAAGAVFSSGGAAGLPVVIEALQEGHSSASSSRTEAPHAGHLRKSMNTTFIRTAEKTEGSALLSDYTDLVLQGDHTFSIGLRRSVLYPVDPDREINRENPMKNGRVSLGSSSQGFEIEKNDPFPMKRFFGQMVWRTVNDIYCAARLSTVKRPVPRAMLLFV